MGRAMASAMTPPAHAHEFLASCGWQGAEIQPLAGDASTRRYERLILPDRRAVLMDALAAISAVVPNPPPEVLITGTTDVGVQWSLSCTVPTPRQVAAVRSQLYFAVLKEFQARKIRITASPAV